MARLREALLASLAALGAAAACMAAPPGRFPPGAPLPILDAHIHIYDPSRPGGVPWPAPSDGGIYRTVLPDDHLRLAGPTGVTGALVVEASDRLEDNQWVLDRIRDLPAFPGMIGNLRIGEDAFAGALERFSRDAKFLGIRLRTQTIRAGGLSGPVLRDLRDLAARGEVLEFQVSAGPGNSLDDIRALAEAVPELPVMLDHMASARVDGRAPEAAWARSLRRLALLPRVHCKVSGLVNLSDRQPAPADLDYYRPVLDLLWEAFGEDRLVYGSNWPVTETGGDFKAQQDLVLAYFQDKGPGALAKVMAGNAYRFYGLGPAGGTGLRRDALRGRPRGGPDRAWSLLGRRQGMR